MFSNYINFLKFSHFGLWLSYKIRQIKFKKFVIDKFVKILINKKYSYIDKSEGYKILDFSDDPDLKKVIELCIKNYSIPFIEKNNINTSKKNTLNIVNIDINDPINKSIKKFCNNDKLISVISKYLEAVPILFNVQVWYSPNKKTDDIIGSQLYHYDREDFRQIKCFIPIEDIDKDSGPLTLISSKDSKKFVLNNLLKFKLVTAKGRFDDEQIKNVIKNYNEILLCCKKGQVALVDTTQCLHYGSRPAEKYKYHLSIQYLSPYSPKLDGISNKFYQNKSPEDLILAKYLNNKN